MVLARVARATQLFEAAVWLSGKPISSLTKDDLCFNKELKKYYFKESVTAHVAHYRRVYHDLASFIAELDDPEPFNFVFDPRAASATLKNAGTVAGYPEHIEQAQEHYTARRWDFKEAP